jgi:hypothetical protein
METAYQATLQASPSIPGMHHQTEKQGQIVEKSKQDKQHMRNESSFRRTFSLLKAGCSNEIFMSSSKSDQVMYKSINK